MRKWLIRLLYFSAAAVFLLLFVVLPVGASFLITNSRFRFPERGPGRPEDVGLPAETAEFSSSDGVELRGWWHSGDPQFPVVIFVHGLNRSRVEMLERATEAHRRGYGVLLFDLRNHGESGRAYTTLGIHEARDVCAASAFVRQRAPGREQVLWGVSLGAATALLAVRDCGGFAGVISDSAFLSFRETIGHHLGLFFGLPAFPFAQMIVGLTAWRMDMDADSGDVEVAVKGFGDVPILFIAGENDRRMPPEIARRLFAAATSPLKKLWVVPGAGHGNAFAVDSDGYITTAFGFLDTVRSR